MNERGTPNQTWPMIAGLSAFALAAVAIAAVMLAMGRADPVLAAGAVFLLAAGQIAVILGLSARIARIEDQARIADLAIDRLAEQVEQSGTRLDEAERLAREPGRRHIEELMADVRALGGSVAALMAQSRTPGPPKPQEAPPSPGIRWNASQPHAASARAGTQRLDLLLEPVIELATGATAHYRALLDLACDGGQVVQHDELMSKADSGGMRPALDLHLLKQLVPVLRRLRNRNAGLRVFAMLGMSTLQSPDDLGRISSLLEADQDVVRGLVFEIAHRDLGRLDDAGLGGLARLARLGATFALVDVQVAGLDLAALRQLGVRYLAFPPAAADAGFGPTPAWREFVQYARAMQFQIIMSDIQSSQQAEAAVRVGRYAFGPFYAPPRRVRTDAGIGAAAQRSAAA